MKLVVAIVNDNDSEELIDAITQKNFMATRLATTGGFLKEGNTTLIIGVKEADVNEVVDIIKDICKERTEILSTPAPIEPAEVYIQYPMEVIVGGATIFVIDVDQFMKI